MKQNFYLLIAMVCFGASYSQNEGNIWYFGSHAGIDFNSGSPVVLLDSALDTVEGVATISDADGNLLFYTDGVTVWNKTHAVMNNGTGLLGHPSSTQSAIIVPKPGSLTLYYIFTVSVDWQSNIYYSEVDMQLDSGLGAVTANKNIPFITSTTEQITGVVHENGTDIWVIAHGFGNNEFYVHLVTASGVGATAVTSNVGMVLYENGNDSIGYMKASPDGGRVATCNAMTGTQLFDFNNSTGAISNALLLTDVTNDYGVEFSPSGHFLYTSNEITSDIIQYDLQAADIPGSAITVLDTAWDDFSGGALQLAPDGKIYKSVTGSTSLTVINEPEIAGTGCNVEPDAVNLQGRMAMLGLPTFIQSYFVAGNIGVSQLCLGDTTQFTITANTPPDSVAWTFGDGGTSGDLQPGHEYAAAGSYDVTATVVASGITTVVEKTITILPLPIAIVPDTFILCDEGNDGQEVFHLPQQDAALLGTQPAADFSVGYYASQADALAGTDALPDNFTNASSPQTIYARVTNNAAGCYAVTGFQLEVVSEIVIAMPDEYRVCEGETITLGAPTGFDAYLWSTGAATRTIQTGTTGSYTVTVYKNHGDITCEATKQVTVTGSQKPFIARVDITDWTEDRNSITIIAEGTGNYEYSIDGMHYQDSPVFSGLQSGYYRVYVRDKDGCGNAESAVYLLMYPKFFTPNGDGENETWRIKDARFEPDMLVTIFDRYGKLITSFKGLSAGWDGTLNGQKLPATDYWFTVQRQDGRELKGHFSMIR
jgi:gliding motility-associated-like protein